METLVESLRDYSSSERLQFQETLSRLMAEGLLLRDEESDRKDYAFAVRRFSDCSAYLSYCGWELLHHERLHVLQILRADGAHRKRFTKEQTSWLLLLRLLYAEQKESMKLSLVRNPVVRVSEVFERYTQFFPGENVRRKTALTEALRLFHKLKLLRPTETRFFAVADPDTALELLSTLEVVVPASKLQEVDKRLKELVTLESRASRRVDADEDENEIETGEED